MKEPFITSLERELIERYGELLATDPLYRLLGYSTPAALKQSLLRKELPAVPIFRIENRRGMFALTKDVAAWLAEKRFTAIESNKQGGVS